MATATTAQPAPSSAAYEALAKRLEDALKRITTLEKKDAVCEEEAVAQKAETATLKEENAILKQENAALKSGKVGWWPAIIILGAVVTFLFLLIGAITTLAFMQLVEIWSVLAEMQAALERINTILDHILDRLPPLPGQQGQ